MCDRYWFFTWRAYGTWLPGRAGFVGYYHTDDGRRVIDNAPGEPTTDAIPLLERYAGDIMTGEPLTVGPDTDVFDCMRLCTDSRIRHLPVVQGNAVVGVISIGDLVKAVIDAQAEQIEHLQRYITS